MALYAAAIFLSAFLLFEVQPIIAKMILPWFGGTSSVWSTCMLFFQSVLLLGYLYAHWLHERLEQRWQTLVHVALLLGSLLAASVVPDPSWQPLDPRHPSVRILALLAASIGLPYFLLSTTSPLLQAWYADSRKEAVPYRLFALSNLASLSALLSYPVLIEPHLPSRTQARLWSDLYGIFVLLSAVIAWRGTRSRQRSSALSPEANAPAPPSAAHRLLWVGLAACASILLVAVTAFLTQDVAAIPFLWVLPLSLYLLTFIVCFEAPSLYRRALFMPLLSAALVLMAWFASSNGRQQLRMRPMIALYCLGLFACCMVCHGEVVRLRPHLRYLTAYYVSIAAGGTTGGVFVGLLAPAVFRNYSEFPIGLGLCASLAVLVLVRERARRRTSVILAGALGAYLLLLGYGIRSDSDDYRVVARNFYGRLAVYDDPGNGEDDAARKLLHGTINHGQQMLNEAYRRQPVAYFCPQTGIGRALRARKDAVPWRIGILGLGCGTLAAYGRPGDTIRIYEINPLVVELARTQFTYLADTAAQVSITVGDGRLSLTREPDAQFDLLAMDAFSGDSVPVHLITREAFRIYFEHLKPGGILAVNISNRYVDLRPVMERAASGFGKVAWLYEFTPDSQDYLCFACSWVLILDPAAAASAPPLLLETAKPLRPAPQFRIWTDDFSNLLGVLK